MSQKILSWKYVGKKNLHTNFWLVRKICQKYFSPKILFGPINVPWTNVASPNKFVCPKKWVPKMLAPKTLESKNFFVLKGFSERYFV